MMLSTGHDRRTTGLRRLNKDAPTGRRWQMKRKRGSLFKSAGCIMYFVLLAFLFSAYETVSKVKIKRHLSETNGNLRAINQESAQLQVKNVDTNLVKEDEAGEDDDEYEYVDEEEANGRVGEEPDKKEEVHDPVAEGTGKKEEVHDYVAEGTHKKEEVHDPVMERTNKQEEVHAVVEVKAKKPPPYGDHIQWSWDDDSIQLNDLWYGRAKTMPDGEPPDLSKFAIHGVLSHCLGDLGWLREYLGGFNFQSFTVVSKCGVDPNLDQLPAGTLILEWENVGRIDHTVAHWIAQMMSYDKASQRGKGEEITLFLKDNVIVHCEAVLTSLETMLKKAAIDGFGCALEPRTGKSFFHLTGMLSSFSMEDYSGVPGQKNSPSVDHNDVFKSNYTNMGAWLQEMGISLPEPVTPVCYGGNFAVRRSQMEQLPLYVWLNLERSLSRGNNIEEGHFAERTWAGLFHRQLTKHEKDILFYRTNGVSYKNEAMRGALQKGYLTT